MRIYLQVVVLAAVAVLSTGNVGDNVTSIYNSNRRLMRVEEWDANPANPNNADALALYDQGAQQLAVVNTSTGVVVDVLPNYSDSSVDFPSIAGVTCLNGAAPINILDIVTDLAFIDNTIDSCLCASSYMGLNCSTQANNTCSGVSVNESTINTGQQIIKNGINGGSINSIAESVEFSISSPRTSTRIYTSFAWKNCVNSATTSNNALLKFSVDTNSTDCNDAWSYGYRVADLVSVCGLSINKTDPNQDMNDSWVRYRGDFDIYFNESVVVGLNNETQNMTLTRTSRLVTPIDVFIVRQYQTELNRLNTATSIQIYSDFQIKGAVTNTNIKANATTATVDITFLVSSPYQVVFINNTVYDSSGRDTGAAGVTWVDNTDPSLTAAYMVDATGNIITTPVVDISSNAGLLNCANENYDSTTGFCSRTIRVLIIVGAACSLNTTFTFEVIGVGCNEQHVGSDCPLGYTVDTTTSASFSVVAADFCDGQRALVINDAVVIQSYVPQRDLDRTNDTALRSFSLNDYGWLVLFLDQAKSLKVYGLTGIVFETKLSGSPSADYKSPGKAAIYLNDANQNQAVLNSISQGFDITTQTYAMYVQMDKCFVSDPDGTNCQITPGYNGNYQGVDARLTFQVDYEALSTGRRRRQAAATNRGYASAETSSTVQTGPALSPSPESAAHRASVASIAVAAGAMICAVLLA